MLTALIKRVVVIAWAAAACAAHGQPSGSGPDYCAPWDNGRYDGRGAQTSQIGFGLDWRQAGRLSFDDFWLCESGVYKVNTLRATLCTDAVVPKAALLLVRDCDGLPDLDEGVIAIADSVPINTDGAPLGTECIVGSVQIAETGRVNADGFRQIDVTVTFPSLWLRGGHYWVSFFGYSGTGNPLEQVFWGFAGGPVKGRPSVFFDSLTDSFEDSGALCCGCTDLNFCLQADQCQVLLDNGGPDTGRTVPSLVNPGATFRRARAADDVVIPACEDRRVCFVEGYILTNCDPPRARLDIFRNDCRVPAGDAPLATFDARCLFDLNQTVRIGTQDLKLYKAQFWDLRAGDGSPLVLPAGSNYWFSVYTVGSGSQSQRGYALGAARCDRACSGRTQHFNQAAVSGPGVGRSDGSWIPVEQVGGTPFDLAFLIATDEVIPAPSRVPAGPAATPACPADSNRDGRVTVQDLFDFLAAWFRGCP